MKPSILFLFAFQFFFLAPGVSGLQASVETEKEHILLSIQASLEEAEQKGFSKKQILQKLLPEEEYKNSDDIIGTLTLINSSLTLFTLLILFLVISITFQEIKTQAVRLQAEQQIQIEGAVTRIFQEISNQGVNSERNLTELFEYLDNETTLL